MDKKDTELIEKYGFIVACESPFEIEDMETDDIATGIFAEMILRYLKEESN